MQRYRRPSTYTHCLDRPQGLHDLSILLRLPWCIIDQTICDQFAP